MNCPRDHLHRLTAGSVAPDIFEIMPATDEHPMPCEQHLAGKRHGERAVEIDHHLSHALFRWSDAPVVCRQSELLADRGLHAGAIQNLAFDLCGGHGLGADGFDGYLAALFAVQMLDCAHEG